MPPLHEGAFYIKNKKRACQRLSNKLHKSRPTNYMSADIHFQFLAIALYENFKRFSRNFIFKFK